MTEKSKTLLILFFILALAAGLVTGPGLPACAQVPEETDADEIIDCSSDPDSCEEADGLIYGYTPPVLPSAERADPADQKIPSGPWGREHFAPYGWEKIRAGL